MREIVASFFHKRLVREVGLLLLSVGLLLTIESFVSPNINDIRYSYLLKERSTKVLPISIPAAKRGAPMEVWATLTLKPFQTTQFTVRGDDCIMSFIVNGTPVINTPNCSFDTPAVTLDLKPYLQKGGNNLHFTIKDIDGVKNGLSIEPSGSSLVLRTLRLLQVVIPFLFFMMMIKRKLGGKNLDIVMILFIGLLLRLFYTAVTAYHIRNYDVEGHIQYIEFMSKFWSVPPAAGGWSYHQGPLYYFLVAPLLTFATFLGHSRDIGFQWIQYVSLYLSCITLIVLTRCGFILFDSNKERWSLQLFTALMACFPVLIMLSSRINNDVLFQVMAYTFLCCLLLWWKKGDHRWLIITSIVVGLGFLTKANSYLFTPILLICIMFRPGSDASPKIRHILTVVGIITAIAGWLLVIRYLEHDFVRLFTAGDGMNSSLRISQSWQSYTTFLPWNIVTMPFVLLRSGIEREYFWMFFFRTSLFGEFHFPGANSVFYARMLALLGIGSLVAFPIGLYKQIKENNHYIIPLLVCLIIVIEGAIAYAALHQSAPNQDFRFSILTLPIVAYFCVKATSSNTATSQILRAWLWAFAVIGFAFMTTVILHNLLDLG